jgi:hypothetical protein
MFKLREAPPDAHGVHTLRILSRPQGYRCSEESREEASKKEGSCEVVPAFFLSFFFLTYGKQAPFTFNSPSDTL